jgi:hypothetical protein
VKCYAVKAVCVYAIVLYVLFSLSRGRSFFLSPIGIIDFLSTSSWEERKEKKRMQDNARCRIMHKQNDDVERERWRGTGVLKSPLHRSHLLWSVVPLGKPGGFHGNAGEEGKPMVPGRVRVPGASEDKRGDGKGAGIDTFGDDVGTKIPLLLLSRLVKLLRIIILVEYFQALLRTVQYGTRIVYG